MGPAERGRVYLLQCQDVQLQYVVRASCWNMKMSNIAKHFTGEAPVMLRSYKKFANHWKCSSKGIWKWQSSSFCSCHQKRWTAVKFFPINHPSTTWMLQNLCTKQVNLQFWTVRVHKPIEICKQWDVKIICLESELRFDKGSCFGCTLILLHRLSFVCLSSLCASILSMFDAKTSETRQQIKPQKILPNYTPAN